MVEMRSDEDAVERREWESALIGDALTVDAAAPAIEDGAAEEVVNYVLADCFFSVGQGVGQRKALEHTALIWWRDRYHAKFLRTLHAFGNRWLADRARMTAVCRMLGDRAVFYAGDTPSIDLAAARRASLDVEKYCTEHAKRKRRARGQTGDDDRTMFAGYWCAG